MAKEGHWYLSGGIADQTHGFFEACEFVWAINRAIESELGA
jgi:hypothetical protein